MGIGTSKGAFFEDEFAHVASPWMESPNSFPDNMEVSPNSITPYHEEVDSNEYETKLSTQEEEKFQDWKSKMAPNDSGYDYDLRGAFKAGAGPDQQSGHWPDTFKKPNHPTFSNQSMYAIDRPDLAGSWNGDLYISPKAIDI